MRYRTGGIVVLLACSGFRAGAAQQPERWRFAGVTFPVTVDTFVNNDAHRWVSNPALGMSLGYIIPGDAETELTLYVYPVRAADSLAAHGDATAERDQAAMELEQYALKSRDTDEFRRAATAPLVIPGASGAQATFFMRYGQDRYVSLLYVFVRNNRYYKLRATYFEEDGDVMLDHIRAFMADVLTSVRPEN